MRTLFVVILMALFTLAGATAQSVQFNTTTNEIVVYFNAQSSEISEEQQKEILKIHQKLVGKNFSIYTVVGMANSLPNNSTLQSNTELAHDRALNTVDALNKHGEFNFYSEVVISNSASDRKAVIKYIEHRVSTVDHDDDENNNNASIVEANNGTVFFYDQNETKLDSSQQDYLSNLDKDVVSIEGHFSQDETPDVGLNRALEVSDVVGGNNSIKVRKSNGSGDDLQKCVIYTKERSTTELPTINSFVISDKHLEAENEICKPCLCEEQDPGVLWEKYETLRDSAKYHTGYRRGDGLKSHYQEYTDKASAVLQCWRIAKRNWKPVATTKVKKKKKKKTTRRRKKSWRPHENWINRLNPFNAC